MNVPRSLTRLLPSWRKLHKTVTICLLVSLLAGLIPPPLLTAVADATLPASVADAAAALLPDTPAAQAVPVVAPPASTLQRVNAAPLAQAVSGSNILTITKMISGTGSGPFDLTITGPSGYLTTTQIDGGQTKVLTGLANGVYTVTETSPGAGWTTVYTATPGTGGSSQAVVSLQNINTAILAATPISGEVFRDFNSDGEITANGTITDTGVPSVTVTVYDKSGNSVGSVTTDSNGAYTINPTGDGPYRVEFSNLPSGYEPTTRGGSNGTSTQFVTTAGAASNVNLGINRPGDYCQSNPQLAATCQIAGDSTSAVAPSAVLHQWGYGLSGTATPPDDSSLKSQIGSVWGLAYARQQKMLYTAAFLRRHVGLGPNGLGAIYRVDPNADSANGTLFVDLAAAGIDVGGGAVANSTGFASNSTRGLTDPNAPTNSPYDAVAFTNVGKLGLGDIDISDDESMLWVTNLHAKTLVAVPTNNPNAGNIESYPINYSQCTGGEARPFGVKYYNSAVYVGLICDASTSGLQSDLKAVIYRFDPTTETFSETFSFSLDYTKGSPYSPACDGGWFAWTDTEPADCSGSIVYPQPILSDIEFDADSSLVVGFADRTSFQSMANNSNLTGTLVGTVLAGGDILRVAYHNGVYTLEDNGVVGSLTSNSGVGNGQGPGGGEFYAGEKARNHMEVSSGGLAMMSSRQEVVLTAYDPMQVGDETNGVMFMSNQQGDWLRGYQVQPSGAGYAGKGSGMGDVELLCDAAPIEIGNRVWDDLDGDGVQDPGEPGLDNTTVTATGSDGSSRTATTDVAGNYYFTATANTVYTLTVSVPAGYSLTTSNAEALSGASVSSNHAISDTRDSDAALVGGVATIYYTAGSAGQNNHGLDFGFTQPASGQVDILNVAPVPVPDPGGFSISKAIATTDGSSPSVSGSFDVVVTCPGVSGYPATLSLNADGTPLTAGNLVSGTVCSFSEDTLTLPAAPSGYTWVNAKISPASITIVGNMTATVTAHNTLAPLPEPPTHVLTVTKTISGTGSGPFDLTITGPSGYLTTTTIDGGQTKTLTGLANGIYTVTESTPAGWTTVYTATPGSVSSVSGVVTVANENTAILASTPITGTVFRDFNSDGLITANGAITDTGIADVTVTAYDKSGNHVGSATTDSNGDYTINPTGDGPYRVEFSDLPSGYQPTTQGVDNGTSTQFVTTSGQAGNVNLGVGLPSQYCEDNPTLATTCLRTTGASAENAVVSFLLNDTLGGVFNNTSQTPAIAQTTHATQSVIGAVYGLAWQRTSQTLFAGAFGKVNSDFGPAGPGGLYAIDLNNHTTSVFIDFDSPAYFGAGSVGNTVGNDASLVGKVGLGDVELAEDEETLYTINLHTKELYVIPVGVPPTAPAVSQIDRFPLPGSTQSGAPTAPANCPSADHLHPFALAWQNDQLYVGLVCGDDMGTGVATMRTNLRAYVYAFDGAAFTQKLDISLDYLRDDQSVVANHNNHAWVRWNSNQPTLRDQPWLTDIAFDGDDMLLGFRARNGDQGTGADTAVRGGELLRACADGVGGWTIENGGSCGGVAQTVPATSAWTGLAIDEHGPGGGEWYWDDDGGEGEAVTGGLAQIPGRAYLLTTHADGTGMNGQLGVWGLHNASGAVVGGANLLVAFTGTDFGKAGNLGDLEVLCDAAPIEIGNRVWDDLDGDGVQDPGEPGLDNTTVSAIGSDGSSRTAMTDVAGSYYFTATANTVYTLTVSVPAGYSLTTPNAEALSGASVSSNHAISDTRDSDAVLVGGVATIYYTTGSAGQNNHGLDFGFTQPASGQVDILNIAPVANMVSLGNRVWYDTNNDGSVTSGEQNVADGVVVELYQDSDSSGGFSAGDTRVASMVTSGGYYTFTNLTPSSSDATRYLVVISDTNFLAGGLLYGYHNSTGQITDNGSAADDNKDHGAVSGTLGQVGGVVASSAISLTASTQPIGEANEGNDPIQAATDANSNQTIDFGFYTLSVGNRVWLDDGGGNSANADNGQLDSGENGLDGVTVELLGSGNAVVSTTTTSNGGYYTFTGLISGTYSVRISGYPATYRSSTDTVNASAPTNADDDDNGPGTATGTLTSPPFALVPGSNANGHSADNVTGVTSNPRIDFGLYEAPASFALDKRLVSPVSGVATVGDSIVYDLVITNTGSITLTTVTLVDSYDADYLHYSSASITPTAQASGVLTWTLTSPTAPLPLSAGEIMTVTVEFTATKP